MSSVPPPKEGKVETSSTKIRQVIRFIQHDEKDKAVELLYQMLEESGYEGK